MSFSYFNLNSNHNNHNSWLKIIQKFYYKNTSKGLIQLIYSLAVISTCMKLPTCLQRQEYCKILERSEGERDGRNVAGRGENTLSFKNRLCKRTKKITWSVVLKDKCLKTRTQIIKLKKKKKRERFCYRRNNKKTQLSLSPTHFTSTHTHYRAVNTVYMHSILSILIKHIQILKYNYNIATKKALINMFQKVKGTI